MKNYVLALFFLFFCNFLFAQNLSGIYHTDFNDLTLHQNGNKVFGTYKYENGRIEGVLNGHTLSGWWYQSNGKGKFVFEFNSDFSKFNGKWGYNDAVPSSKWNGTRLKRRTTAINKSFVIDGTFHTDFNDLTLHQNGNKVFGTYKYENGRIEGVLNGHTLTGWWYQSNGKGKFVFEFNSDFSKFNGKWGYNDAVPSSKWNGTRLKRRTTAINKSFVIDGTFHTDFNDLTLHQNGNKVFGTYKYENGRIEGVLNGHTLSGWWYQSNGKGKFVFEFNSDFSKFNGKWGYNDAVPSSKWNGTRLKTP